MLRTQAANQTLAPGQTEFDLASGYEGTACGWYTVDVTSVSSIQAAASAASWGDFIEMKVVNYSPPSFVGDCSDLPPPCHPIISPASETVLGSASGAILKDGGALTSVALDSPAASAGLGGDTRLFVRAYQFQPDGGPQVLTDLFLEVGP